VLVAYSKYLAMEFTYNNLKAYICTLDDYSDIFKIHQSRPAIHNHIKTDEYNLKFPTVLRVVLRGIKADHYVLGVRDLTTNQLVSYSIVHIPIGHPFSFIKFIESIVSENFFAVSSGLGHMVRLLMMLGQKSNKFDIFVAIKLKSFISGMKCIKKFVRDTNPGIFDYNHYLLHSVVEPDQQPVTPLEKHLLADRPSIPRTKTIGIIQIALKSEYRLSFFEDKLKLKHLDKTFKYFDQGNV
jgi:hypothetical protein